jgi:hypothetical protein
VLGAPMPVAAVDEDCDFDRTEHHVRCPAKVWQWARGNAVAQPLGMNQPPDQLFGPCVTAADRLHIATAGCGRSPGTLWRFPLGIFGHTAERSTRGEAQDMEGLKGEGWLLWWFLYRRTPDLLIVPGDVVRGGPEPPGCRPLSCFPAARLKGASLRFTPLHSASLRCAAFRVACGDGPSGHP